MEFTIERDIFLNHDKYNEIKEKAYRMSKVNRKESDRLEYEANNILKEIDDLRS